MGTDRGAENSSTARGQPSPNQGHDFNRSSSPPPRAEPLVASDGQHGGAHDGPKPSSGFSCLSLTRAAAATGGPLQLQLRCLDLSHVTLANMNELKTLTHLTGLTCLRLAGINWGRSSGQHGCAGGSSGSSSGSGDDSGPAPATRLLLAALASMQQLRELDLGAVTSLQVRRRAPPGWRSSPC